MENKVTRLEVQKKDRHRVNVFLDDKYAFSLDIMMAATLRLGQTLSEDKINELKVEGEYSLALNSAILFLGYRARSIKEMEAYISVKKKYSQYTTNRVIEKLVKEKYLDDDDFARMWIENRVKFNPKGARALFYELRNKGVEDAVIEDALLDYDDNKAAWSAVQKKILLWEKLESKKFQKKLYTFLSSRGFDYETTKDIYNRAIGINSD